MYHPFEDNSADQLAIDELLGMYVPVVLFRLGFDAVADGSETFEKRRFIVVPFGRCWRLLGRFHHFIGEVIDEADEEVPRTHCRVANFQLEERACGVNFAKLASTFFDRPAIASK